MMIAQSVFLIFLGVVLIQANSLDSPSTDAPENHDSTTRESKALKALKLFRNVLFRGAADELAFAQQMPTDEQPDTMRMYITTTSKKLSKLIQDITQLAKSFITSSTKMALTILNVTSNSIADDVEQLRPMLREISSDLEDFKPKYYEFPESTPDTEFIPNDDKPDNEILVKKYPKKFVS